MSTQDTEPARIVYWHRELPPLDADPLGEHTVEAKSDAVAGIIAHRDDLWDQCYEQLMTNVKERIEQEVARLGGRYAHVLEEHVTPKHDELTNRSWLTGRFNYVLFGTSTGST
jgi:hypothetical protein